MTDDKAAEAGIGGKTATSSGRRATWGSKMDFFMTAISSAVGLGNIWRFPYKCYSNGGGAFLMAFIIMVFMVGFPLVCLDLALGQLGRCGPLEIWKICPAFEGVGWSIFGLDFVANIYYIVLVAFGMLYMFYSFRAHLPWASCGNHWNTPDCRDLEWVAAAKHCLQEGGTFSNGSCVLNNSSTPLANHTIIHTVSNTTVLKPLPPSEEFFNNAVLQLSEGVHDVGGVQLPLLACLFLSWAVIFLGLSFGVKSWGKISYVTTLLPYVILVSLLIQTLREPGSVTGILYFFNPDWTKLASAKVWTDAAVQAFFSLNCGGGVLITIGSFNKRRNNCFCDGIILTLCDFVTSMLCGVVVFAIIGHLAHALAVPVSDVVGKGAGLAFVVYPEMLARMPLAPLWSSLFMFVIFNLGIGSCLPLTANIQTILVERFPSYLSVGRRPLLLLVALVTCWALLGVVLTTQAGMYIVQLLDMSVPYVLVFTGLCKVIAVGWVYGLRRFIGDLGDLVGRHWGRVWWVTCTITAPLIIVVVTVANLVDYSRLSYGDYVFPIWADVLGWCITLVISSAVPLTALYRYTRINPKLSHRQRLRQLLSPSSKWTTSIRENSGMEATQPLNVQDTGDSLSF